MGRKFFIVLFLGLILLGGGVFYLWFLGQKSLAKKAGLLATKAETPFYLRDQGDNDSDGLKDWEELLWRTDLANPDSDGDGTPDGEEVKLDRNPLKSGPDDQLIAPEEKLVSLVNQALRDRSEPLAEIEPGIETSPSSGYTAADLRTTPDSPVTLETYATNFKIFITAMNNFKAENGVKLTLEVIKNNDDRALSQLQAMASFYQTQAEQLARTTMPQSAATTHLNLINRVAGLAENINNMAQIRQEPIVALQSTQDYTKKVVEVVNAITAVDVYLQQQGIKL